MLQRSLAELAGHLQRSPSDLSAWVELAHRAARTGTRPNFVRTEHLGTLLELWRSQPAIRALGALVLPLLGFEPAADNPEPTAWWRQSGRLVEDPDGSYDRATGLPLVVVDAVSEVRLRWIPRGRYTRGSMDWLAEQPIHEVEAGGLYVGEGPVRVREMAKYLAANMPGVEEPHRQILEWDSQLEFPERPAVFVNWHVAQGFCAWTGGRIPRECEWEWAARSDDGRYYPWGDARPTRKLTNVGRVDYDDDAWLRWIEDVGVRPGDVGPFGHVDLIGNVSEWTADWHGQYPDGPVVDPLGWPTGTLKVVRGGCFRSELEAVPKATTRSGWAPSSCGEELGFRVVRPLDLVAEE